jgi:hypothetical protein
LDEEKSKFAGLVQEEGFWMGIIAQIAVASNTVHLQKKECNKYDPTAAQYF